METNSYPASSLRYALAKRTVVELRSLARSYYVKGRSRMRKSALIEAVFYELLDMDRLIELAYVTDPYTWDLFQRAAVERVVMVDSAAPPRYRLLVELGYLSCGETEVGVCLSMPDELKAVFIDLAMGGLPEQKQRFDLIHAYAQAATNLYGVIGLKSFAALFNQQNEEPASIDELLSVLYRHISVDATYCIWEQYLVNEGYKEDSRRKVAALLARVGDKPRYIPAQEELLRYADPSYFEQTEHTDKLEQYLKKHLRQEAGAAREIVTLFHFACEIGAEVSAALHILCRRGIKLTERRQTEITGMVIHMFNTTRTSRNNGHTPEELRRLGAPPQPHQEKWNQTPGRNTPCSCGSGKKYKKCCGR